MRVITGFTDIEGLPVAIVPSNVFAIRRLTKARGPEARDENIVEIISTAGTVISIVEKESKFENWLRESLE